MIDLNEMVERFLEEAVRQCKYDEKGDEVVIRALNDRNQSTADSRKEVLKQWLRYYGALKGLNAADRDAVPSVIVDFAETRCSFVSPCSEVEIIEKFDDLHNRCSSTVHPKKDLTLRRLTSLVSKALWCCYPDTVPLFDAYARRALWVVSRLMGLDRPAGEDNDIPYTRFVKVWLNLYHRVTIDDNRLDGYPFKVRVFDKIL